MELLENMKWRYATKKFNAGKKVREEDINKIKESIQLAATSYGLQLFKVIDVKDESLREQLKPASWGQSQITDASHLFVFCNYSAAKDEHVDQYMNLKATTQGIDIENLKGYGDFVKGALAKKPQTDQQIWMAKQTYIALSNAMMACADLKIDSTPMEGFDPAAYNEILGLDNKGLQAAVVLTIGYRSEEDPTLNQKKVRKSIEDLFETV